MSQTLTISDDLFGQDERARRVQAVACIDLLRQRLFAKYGEMPDSATLVREDRER
ncbi:MAG: hypothetical protein K2R98_19650 [Gemmataceae bacterium]|nr:hypothetical protein [Gemmataceae bacterium]